MQTFHRFPTRAAFLAACDAAGWARDHLGMPDPPPRVALDVIGPYAPPPTVVNGVMVPAAWDGRWHVNVLWPGDDEPPAEWEAARINPATPSRTFGVKPPRVPDPPPVPDRVPAWTGKTVLREAGRLAGARAAVDLAGGRTKDAWDGKTHWERNSPMIAAIASALSLTSAQVDQMFRDADAIRG